MVTHYTLWHDQQTHLSPSLRQVVISGPELEIDHILDVFEALQQLLMSKPFCPGQAQTTARVSMNLPGNAVGAMQEVGWLRSNTPCSKM